MARFGIIFRRIMSDHEFQPLHCPQPALESFSSLNNVVHVWVVKRLCGQGGVIGGSVEKGGFSEIGKHCERDSVIVGEGLAATLY